MAKRPKQTPEERKLVRQFTENFKRQWPEVQRRFMEKMSDGQVGRTGGFIPICPGCRTRGQPHDGGRGCLAKRYRSATA
jgi:hypothetical protein